MDAMAAQGLRVIGVAGARHAGRTLPDAQTGFDFHFIGLIALSDPLRPEVPQAVRECREAGIRLIMITGDYPATALSIAAQAGLPAVEVLNGDEVDRLDEAACAAGSPRSASVPAYVPRKSCVSCRLSKPMRKSWA
ncbi:HAD family hydrolase [Duganella radicis]|nr:HAD family hydrolase [Duganella radicis]